MQMQNPETMQAFDSVRLMLDLYRRAGVKNATDWLRRGGQMDIMADEQAMNAVDGQNTATIPAQSATPRSITGNESSRPAAAV